ncbi:hypothetical protein CFter6_4527 [Collimonas fungivorans]|uniref:Uncharacterized protein n=1 Tax=Collimonas fungivorans TaxID=158899 RepID=A0A127PH94_9BURK|nr:hypothetical protein CFter6_4527 [Collimonas fungivorans]
MLENDVNVELLNKINHLLAANIRSDDKKCQSLTNQWQ